MRDLPFSLSISLHLVCLVLISSVAETSHAAGNVGATPKQKAAFDFVAATRKVDEFIAAQLHKKQIEPLPISSDEGFLRRIYLDAIGRIPTLDETRSFLSSHDTSKRPQLIHNLLQSRGHVSHDYNYWADILRVKDSDDGVGRAFYVLWIKESLANNKPYDQFVRELITSSGCGWERGCGAVGYYLRDRAMPLDNIANTMRIFTGTRIACAQCHDHPHDRWRRRQMYEMAAFTNNLSTLDRSDTFLKIGKAEQALSDREMQRTSQMIRTTFYRDRVSGTSDGKIALPADYQYEDAKPGQKISAHPMFEPVTLPQKDNNPDYRQRFGDWLTSPENPRFTQVIANRLWKRVLRRGLVEPVDDLHDDTKASHPELLAYLTQLMKDLHYDMRAYVEVLYNTETYQRAVDPNEPTEGESNDYRGRLLARMTAEQVWDSLLTLMVPNIDAVESGLNKSTVYYEGRPVLVGKTDMYSLYEQVKNNTPEQHWAFLAGELKKIKEDLKTQEAAMKDAKGATKSPYNYNARASELYNPAPRNHFLRTFGQSTREFIEAGSTSSNVTQFLSMFNGVAEQQILQNRDSELRRHLQSTKSATDACDVAFLSVLSRQPTKEERDTINASLDPKESKWNLDLAWALLNSQEFMFY
jgi:hypothetical protein